MSQKLVDSEIWESNKIRFASVEHFSFVDLEVMCMSCDKKETIEVVIDAVCT